MPDTALPDTAPTWENVAAALRTADFEQRWLPTLLREARWFGGKAHPLRDVRVLEFLPLGESSSGRLALLQANYADRPPEIYVLPLQLAPSAPEKALVIARLNGGVLFDALHDAAFRDALFETVLREKRVSAEHGEVVGICGAELRGVAAELALPLASRALAAEQSNSAIVYGGRWFLKLYRKPEAGENPDAELLRFLSERQKFAHVPAFCGAIEHRPASGESRTLALVVANVRSEGDAWTFTLAALDRHFASAGAEDAYPDRARQLGQRTAEMHLALAADPDDPAFAPEPFTAHDLRSLAEASCATARRTMELLRGKLVDIPQNARAVATALLAREDEILGRFSALTQHEVIATKTRHHGDYHLGQVLETGGDFVIIDFEGEPARSLAERRLKRSPLRDVAGMLRSFHYAAHTALAQHPAADAEWAERWVREISRAFLDAYLATARGASFIPENPASLQMLLEVHVLEKAIYEIAYELNHRPDWVFIPLSGIARMV